jgi:hypothetical protein
LRAKSPTGGTWLRRISAKNERNASPDGNDRSPEVRARAATFTAAGGEMEKFPGEKNGSNVSSRRVKTLRHPVAMTTVQSGRFRRKKRKRPPGGCTDLLEMSLGGAQEDDGEVAGGGGRHGRQQDGHRGHGTLEDRLSAAQRRVHVQSAEVLADGLQFLKINETDSVNQKFQKFRKKKFEKIRKISENFQKKFEKISENFQKITKKFQKNFRKFPKNYKKIPKKF